MIAVRLWLTGFVVWFALRAGDAYWPPHNPTFNAMLTLIAVLTVFAGWCERRLPPEDAR